MRQKILLIGLILIGFLVSFSITSRPFDGDFGWHLRFGRELITSGFPYTDSYTYSFFGERWVNHEWGGDILYWIIYSKIGYNALVFLIAGAVWLAFLLAPRIYLPRTTVFSTILSIAGIYSVNFIISPRLTVIAPLFFIILWATLQKLPKKKYIFWWPGLFWLWAALHGSWILGFITVAIYAGGQIGQIILHRIFPQYFSSARWTKKTFLLVGSSGILSFLAIALNPYGTGIWREVLEYFSNNYYKNFISEWVPSYVYPIYWLPIIFAITAGVALAVRAKQKIRNLSEIALFIAFFASAILYKRNNIYLILVSLPFLAIEIERLKIEIASKIENKWKKLFTLGIIGGAILTAIFFIRTTNLTNNPWEDKKLLATNIFPQQAVEFLQKNTNDKTIKIFNEFRWGGYLNWVMPEALVFLDGRGTVSWKKNGEPLYKIYRQMRFEKEGLNLITQSGADYILLQNNFTGLPTPSLTDKIFFGEKLEEAIKPEPTELEKQLLVSKNWKKIYSDILATIWQKSSVK